MTADEHHLAAPPLDEPLSDDELDTLAENIEGAGADFDWATGFLTAVLTGPDFMPPSEWMTDSPDRSPIPPQNGHAAWLPLGTSAAEDGSSATLRTTEKGRVGKLRWRGGGKGAGRFALTGAPYSKRLCRGREDEK